MVVFENTHYKTAMGLPFFAKFAKQGTLLTDLHAITHPSQPNYIAMVAATTHGVKDNQNHDLNKPHLGDLLEKAGKTWRVYAQGYPGNCFKKASAKFYTRKHNPLISFANVQNDPSRCARISDDKNFLSDFKDRKLADFSMLIPDLKNSGHDTGPAFADRWFRQTFEPLLSDTKAMEGVMIIATFDEDDASGKENQIYGAFVGPDVKVGEQLNSRYDLVHILRTIEDIFQLEQLGAEDKARAPIAGFLK